MIIHTLQFKISGIGKIFLFLFLKGISYVYQDCLFDQ